MQSFVWDGYFGIDKSFHFSRILFVIKFLTLLPTCQDKRSNVYVGCFFGMEIKEIALPLVNIKNILNFFILTSIFLSEGEMLGKIEEEVSYFVSLN